MASYPNVYEPPDGPYWYPVGYVTPVILPRSYVQLASKSRDDPPRLTRSRFTVTCPACVYPYISTKSVRFVTVPPGGAAHTAYNRVANRPAR